MTEKQRLWRGFLLALLFHVIVIGVLAMLGFLPPPPLAKPEEPTEVAMLEDSAEEIPALPEESAWTKVPEVSEPLDNPPVIEPEKEKQLPKSQAVSPPAPKEKPPLPANDRKNLFDTEEGLEAAFRAPVLQKSIDAVIPPGTQPSTQPFVALDMIIGKDGRVEKAAISISSGSLGIDQAALAAVKQYTFIAGQDKSGKSVRCAFSITLIL